MEVVAAMKAKVWRCGSNSCGGGDDGGGEEGRPFAAAAAAVRRISRATRRARDSGEDGGLLPDLSRWGVFPRGKEADRGVRTLSRGVPNVRLNQPVDCIPVVFPPGENAGIPAGIGVSKRSLTLSPSPPRITGNARHTPPTAAAPEAPRDTLPTAPAERLDLDLDELSSDTDDDVSIAKLNFFYIRVLFSNILVSLCSSPLG